MSFDLTAFEAYVDESDEIITKTLFTGGDTAKIARYELGVKGKRKLTTIEGDAILQKGTCVTPDGVTSLDNVFIEVTPWTYHESFCVDELEGQLSNTMLAPGSNTESIPKPLEQKMVDVKMSSIQKQLELTYWQGDTAGTYDLFDGIIKAIDTLGTAIDGNTSSATAITIDNIDLLVDDMIAVIPIDVKEDPTCEVELGNDTFDLFIQKMKKLNNYHFNADNDGSTYIVAGSNITIRKQRGLNGTDRMFASVGRNFVVGLDKKDEDKAVDIFYVKETDKVHFRTKAKSGTNVFNAAEIVEFTLFVA